MIQLSDVEGACFIDIGTDCGRSWQIVLQKSWANSQSLYAQLTRQI